MTSVEKQELSACLARKAAELKITGVSVAMRGPGGEAFEWGYGWRDLGRSIVPDGDTVFGIASLGKSMAALCVAILAAEGRLSLDDPVTKYIPAFRVPGNPPDSVTVRHLATHTAGIPPMEPLEWSIAMNTPGRKTEWDRKMQASAPNAMNTIEQVIAYIADCPYPAVGRPGENMSYSNEGYAVLCRIVDAAAGVSLEEFLEERVFAPIGMTRSTLDQDASRARAIAAEGNITALFERGEDGEITGDEDWSILPPFRACACVKSTARDMARYYQCLANGGVIDGRQAIPAQAVEYLIGADFPEQEKAVYCMGLNKRVEDSHVYCEHSGGLHGVSSEGGLLKGENYGFVVLCNQGDADVTELLWILYNAVLGYPPERKHRWLFPTGADFPEPQILTGSYLCHEGVPATAKVYLQEGKLVADRNGTICSLLHCGETWFQLADGKGKIVGRMHFLLRDGRAWGVQVYTRIYQRTE